MANLEQALKDCIDYLTMGGLSSAIRHKLIRTVLIDAHARHQRFIHQNRMNQAYGLPPMVGEVEREGISQLFWFSYHLIIKSGNPAPKINELRSVLFASNLYTVYRPTDDFEQSRRSKQTKIDIEELGELEPPIPSFSFPPTIPYKAK